jgi:acyl-coenzyme A thioesterase PaaI-like protein
MSTATVDPAIRDLFGAYLENSPFAVKCGLELTLMEPDLAEVALPYDETNTTYGSSVCFCAVDVLGEAGNLVATGLVTYKIS